MNGMNRLQQLKHTDRMYAEYRTALDNADMEAELKKHDAPKITDEQRAQLDGWIEVLKEAKQYTYWYHEERGEKERRSYRDEDWYQKHNRNWNDAQANIKRMLDECEYFYTTVPEGAGLPTNEFIKHRYKKPDKNVTKYRLEAAEIRTYNGQQYKEWLSRGGVDYLTSPGRSRKVR